MLTHAPFPALVLVLPVLLTLGIPLIPATVALAADPPLSSSPAPLVDARVTPLFPPLVGAPGFVRIPESTSGVRFTNRLDESRALANHILLNGSGVALGDVTGDGRPDLYLCSLDAPNVLFRNDGGFKFTPITPPEIACPDFPSTGATLLDLDGDGDLDLLVNTIGQGTRCFRNDGNAAFTDVTTDSGLASTSGATTTAAADIDGDGDLDLYVAHYRSSTIRDTFNARLRVQRIEGRLQVTAFEGRPTTDPDLVGRFSVDPAGNFLENGEADALWLNEGGLRFRRVSFTGGAFLDESGQSLREPPFDWSLSAMFRDLDQDGWPDLYVCSDLASPDRIWINRRDGRFQAIAPSALRKSSWFSMGIDFGDLNRDGLDDFLVTDMLSRDHRLRQTQVTSHQAVPSRPGAFTSRPQTPRNTLFLGQGRGDFTEIAFATGLSASDWSWAPVFLDVDLDGFEDVLIGTGFHRDVQDIDVAEEIERVRQTQRLSDAQGLELRRRFPPLHQPTLLFRNRGDLTFEESGQAWGFHDIGISQGLALADLDGDGDLDLVVNRLNDAVGLYRNESIAPRVAVRLRGSTPNTQGIGARIRLLGGMVPEQSQEIIAGGRYLSGDDPVRVFAAGPTNSSMRLEVLWRSGRTSVVEGVRPNSLVEVTEPASPAPLLSRPFPSEPSPTDAPLFDDHTSRLAHVHVEDDFNDFEQQPLLPRKLSQAGPAVAWADLDRDGWPDLVLGTGQGGPLGLFRNDTRGGFTPLPNRLGRRTSRDVHGLLVDPTPGGPHLLATLSNLQGAPGEPSSVVRLDPADGSVADAVPPLPADPGPLALADLDADGDLDLFVGGRGIPGRYPEPADSHLFLRQGDTWIPAPALSAPLAKLGLVRGATFTDLDGNGRPELVVACEWGPIRVFGYGRDDAWIEQTAALGFENHLGLWQGVAAGDFNADGRMDLVAANWGINTRRGDPSRDSVRLDFGEFTGASRVDLIESYLDAASSGWVPWHHFGRVRAAWPFIQESFPNYHAMARATVPDLLGSRASSSRHLHVSWLRSTLFLNRGGTFEARPLPAPAQWSPAFSPVVADFNGDGHEDVFLSQNFFATDPEEDRHDSGRGLLLLGDGLGGFQPASHHLTGIRVDGEQRGAATADFDRDGRPDLVVTQNGASTRLFRNAQALSGLRIGIRGHPGNPHGIGTLLRLEFEHGLGPARELHAGSGYLSQDDPVTVLAIPRPPTFLHAHWPDGRRTRSPVPPGARELILTLDGSVSLPGNPPR